MKFFLLVFAYAAMVALSNAFLKVATLSKGGMILTWFLAGNLIGFGSSIALTFALKNNNPNVVYGLCIGLGFVVLQFLSFFWFKEPLSTHQWLGAVLVCAGVVLLQVK